MEAASVRAWRSDTGRNMSTSSTQTFDRTLPLAAGEFRWNGHMSNGVGTTFGPEPMASLTATSDTLVLSSNLGVFRIPRAAVSKIRRSNLYPWLFAGVRIHHSVPTLPDELQFKPLETHRRVVLQQLATLGYPAA
jgi:hypothetical protein